MISRDEVASALRPEHVLAHLNIKVRWHGRWGRSRRCARTDHSSDAFAIARDYAWHCWACDEGGDLFALLAIGESLDIRNDFGKVLALAAQIAGLDTDDDFGGPTTKPAPIARPEAPALEPIAVRETLARRRAAWVWPRMIARIIGGRHLTSDVYLEKMRGLEARVDVPSGPLVVATREDYRDTPIVCSPAELAKAGPDLEKLASMFKWPGIAVPVRSPRDGAMVDIRVRRFEPREGQPKIVGMLGGITSAPADNGAGRVLLGCYGFPHEVESDTVIVVEGLIDYLTALCVWPTCDVLGAVEAGTMGLVAGIAAKAVAGRANGRVLIVEHADGFAKAGERAVNEDVNSAAKTAIRVLGPRRVGWVFCGAGGSKDLNDLYLSRQPVDVTWWADLGEPAA